ncbi:septum site-determining protein MinC [Selenomonas sp. TAMA-11512]|uniref:septum site-determining protein MinC n=1 Tax=Selenomonas sp. TAMA-11512 TaxID=3095337 RepID=UPI00308CEF5C|nr:septum site-determining protein MinC [Selenomonas sp. TAMA-11512]
MKEKIKIRGIGDGLLLVIHPEAKEDFDAVEEEIVDRLSTGAFKRGTAIELDRETVTEEEWGRLAELFKRAGIVFRPKSDPVRRTAKPAAASAGTAGKHKPAASAAAAGEAVEMLIVDKTVRSGHAIQTKGSVLIMGNVNPGAEVVAGGSIDIRGVCQGVVHAGAWGNRDAFIIADKLMPTQVRIADLIAQAPDYVEKPKKAEKASIKDGHIVIEPLER